MKTKAQYKVKNWNAYDAALKLRGSITFWLDEEVIEQWRNQQKTGKKGASNYYSDTAMSDDKPLTRLRYNGNNSISVSFT
ncbi:transposase [Nostoc sp. DSM 114161]|jgi:hypothetical protein|uniref:transposase n=1 Tax=Nostoc sp. DSM 114161 TaxID=3440143 RepID=UPI00404599A9